MTYSPKHLNEELKTLQKEDLTLSSYHYDLDPKFVASRPVADRHSSKLLVYNAKSNEVIHTEFKNLAKYLPAHATLVANQSKVFPCRLIGKKTTGGKVEIFILSLVPNGEGYYTCLIKSTGKKKVADFYELPGQMTAQLKQTTTDGRFLLAFDAQNLASYLEEYGLIPIPPYIRGGESDAADNVSYQTVYSNEVGSVAASTAGLHFTPEVFDSLAAKDIDQAFVTLHVGLGTFAPVKAEDILEHEMHSEEYFVGQESLTKIKKAKKIFAVGTTSLRVLESSYGKLIKADQHYHTNIFLHPGKEVHSIAGLITNFHLPGSTLLMLVSALIGRKKTLELYEIAKKEQYRFFSYGDAMLIIR